MSEHTPEPWENHIGTIESESGWHIASCVTTNGGKAIANAARIVACVNACAGMEDPAAEIARLRADNDEINGACTRRQLEIYNLRAEIAELRAEREELREAITGLLDAANRNVGGMVPGGVAYWCHSALGRFAERGE